MAKRLTGILVAAALFSVGAAAPAAAAPTSVSCAAPAQLKATIAEVNLISATTSTALTNIPQAKVNFVQGGAAASCVIVRFSAETLADGTPGAMLVQAILDGVSIALPGEVRFGVEDEATVARSYDFIFKQVAPGSHELQMQYRSSNGVNVLMGPRTTSVLSQP
jgi:hypothetical protein